MLLILLILFIYFLYVVRNLAPNPNRIWSGFDGSECHSENGWTVFTEEGTPQYPPAWLI